MQRSMDENAVILQTKEAKLTADKFIYQEHRIPSKHHESRPA